VISQEGTSVAQRNPTLRRVGLVIFFIAILIGLVLTLLRAIPDLEASMYGFIKYGYPRLYSLSCPVLMTVEDSEPVSIRLHNSLDRNLSYFVEAQLSAPYLIVTDDQRLDLQPGESQKLIWQVDKENIDLGSFIFARVFTSAAAANGFHESTCGTFVLNLPLAGGPAIYYSFFILSLLGIALGLWLWFSNRDYSIPGTSTRSGWMIFLAGVVVVGLVTSLVNFWFVAIVTVFLALLSVGVYLIPHKV
jgi:hypothetical protein